RRARHLHLGWKLLRYRSRRAAGRAELGRNGAHWPGALQHRRRGGTVAGGVAGAGEIATSKLANGPDAVILSEALAGHCSTRFVCGPGERTVEISAVFPSLRVTMPNRRSLDSASLRSG